MRQRLHPADADLDPNPHANAADGHPVTFLVADGNANAHGDANAHRDAIAHGVRIPYCRAIGRGINP